VNLIGCYIKLFKYTTNQEKFEKKNSAIILSLKTSHGWRK